MKRILFFLTFALMISFGWSQNAVNLNKYKYLVVDSKFDFVKQVDGYKTSSFTKFLFKKKGFDTYLDNEEFNEDLAQNGCKALYAEVKDNSGFLKTRSYIEITDCKGKLLFRSKEGTSRLKDYARAYREAIRQAFDDVIKIPYEYDPSLSEEPVVVTKAVQTIKEEPKQVVEVKKEAKQESKKAPVMVVKEVPVKNTTTKPVDTQIKATKEKKIPVLYAQPNANGFQLVNTEPAIVFVLLKTNNPQKFIIKDMNGTLTRNGDVWIAEYYSNGQLTTERYQVKF
jgi:hypothetical protein